MYRKGLISMLQDRPASLHELARQLGLRDKEVEDDMRHLLKSLRNTRYRAVITPAACKTCGFVFSQDKLHKPGKCPRCKHTWISDPLVGIEATR